MRPKVQVLDVGPVCGDNINFLARRVKRLYLCDMFFRLVQESRSGAPSKGAWRHLDYLPGSFDGILLWDLVDRLDDHQAGELVERCYSMVMPGGMVMILSLGEQVSPTVVKSFVIKEGFRLCLRSKNHLDLPFHSRRNREVLDMLAPFFLIRSFIYRNGTREFLFQRP